MQRGIKLSVVIAILSSCAAVSLAWAKKPSPSDRADEWYVKTAVEAVDPATGRAWEHRFSGVFGKLLGSADGYDRNDVKAIGSLAGSEVALSFLRGDEWGENAGDYLSSYHDALGDLDSWSFVVYSKFDQAEVTLTWDGLFELTPDATSGGSRYDEQRNLESKLLQKLNLVDLVTGEVTPAVFGRGNETPTLDSYTFTLDPGETSRQFLWVLGSVKGIDLIQAEQAGQYLRSQSLRRAVNPASLPTLPIMAPPAGDPFNGTPMRQPDTRNE
jgi:hypothetical protein